VKSIFAVCIMFWIDLSLCEYCCGCNYSVCSYWAGSVVKVIGCFLENLRLLKGFGREDISELEGVFCSGEFPDESSKSSLL
jgi:hypothetical protein